MSLQYIHDFGIIKFCPSVIEVLSRHKQISPFAPESGGQLFCRFNGSLIDIQKATEPKPSDRRKRFSFWPRRNMEQKEIEELFQEGFHYIGDWHTHPEEQPRPSTTDINKILSIHKESIHSLKVIVLVIVGQSPNEDALWVGTVTHNGITQAQLVSQSDLVP